MREVPVAASGSIAPDEVARFQRELRDQLTLGDVMTWLRAQSPPRTVAEILTQDEYTHDVIVEWSDKRFLAFDAT